MKHVLIIEDDDDITTLLTIHLTDMGCKAVSTPSGHKGLALARQQTFDVIVLDIGLPEITGLEVCSILRREQIETPIILLTARAAEADRITGLEFGADLYITKPFSIIEFKASFNALFRRIEIERKRFAVEQQNKVIDYGSLHIDIDKKAAWLDDQRLHLTAKEYELLALLASNPGKTFTREALLKQIWDYQFQGFEHTVNTHINRLRGKIENDMRNPEYVLTTWGVGYRFKEV